MKSLMPSLVVIVLGLLSGASIGSANDSEIKVELRLSTQGNDIAFDKKAVEIPYTPEIKIRFVNEAAEGSQILHNIAILKPGELGSVIKDLQQSSYDLEKLKNHKGILAMTRALNPGEYETVNFHAPARGFYPYICLMAGHGDMLDMRGVLHLK